MKSEWRVMSNPTSGKVMYGIYRLIDVSDTMHSGNLDVYGYVDSEDVANDIAKELNDESEK